MCTFSLLGGAGSDTVPHGVRGRPKRWTVVWSAPGAVRAGAGLPSAPPARPAPTRGHGRKSRTGTAAPAHPS